MAEKGSFASDLRVLLESGEGADVVLVVGESELPAHSFILAARSPVFAAMLRNDMREASSRRIQISDVGEAALRQMLWFIYTDTVPQLESVAPELLAVADKYDLPLLKKRCEQQMERDIRVENAAATAALAVLHRCPGLKSAAVGFIAEHPEVLATEGWARILRDSVEAAVEVSSQLGANLRPPSVPPKTATKTMAADMQAPEQSDSRIVSKETKQIMTAKLIEAASNGRVREVWALLAAGADKEARDGNGNTVLHLAASNGHAKAVRCLIAWGLDVNPVNSSGQTPLHVATERGDIDVVWVLVAAQAQLDAQDNQGQTALHVAAQKDRIICRFCGWICGAHPEMTAPPPIVKLLLLVGARNDVKNLSGNTPENVATQATKIAFKAYNDL